MAGPVYSQHPAGGSVVDDWVSVALPLEYARRRNLHRGAVKFVDDSGAVERAAVYRKTRGRQSMMFDLRGTWASGAMSGEIVVAAAPVLTAFSTHASVAPRINTAPTVADQSETYAETMAPEVLLDTVAERRVLYRFANAAANIVVLVERITRHGHPVETWNWTPHRRTLADDGASRRITVDVGTGATVVLDRSALGNTELSVVGTAAQWDGPVDWGILTVSTFRSYYGDGSDPLEAIAADGLPAAMFDGWGANPLQRWFPLTVAPRTSVAEQAILDDAAGWRAGTNSYHDRRPNVQNLVTGDAGTQRYGTACNGAFLIATESVKVRDTLRLHTEDELLRPTVWGAPDGHFYTAAETPNDWTYERRLHDYYRPQASYDEEIGGATPRLSATGRRTADDEAHVDDLALSACLALFDETSFVDLYAFQIVERELNQTRLRANTIGPVRAWGRQTQSLIHFQWLFDNLPIGTLIRGWLDLKLDDLFGQWHGRLVPPEKPMKPVYANLDGRVFGGTTRYFQHYEHATVVGALAALPHVLFERAAEAWALGLIICQTSFHLSIPTNLSLYPNTGRWFPYAIGVPGNPGSPTFGDLPEANVYVIGTPEHDALTDGFPGRGWTRWSARTAFLISYLEEALEAINIPVPSAGMFATEQAEVLAWLDGFFEGSSGFLDGQLYRNTACPTAYVEAPITIPPDPPGGGMGYEETDPVGIEPGMLITWEQTTTVGLPGRSMSDVPGILLIGNSQLNGGPDGVATRVDATGASALEGFRDLSLSRVVPSDNATGEPTADDLEWYPWWDGAGSGFLLTVASGTATTVTVTPSPGWTTDVHAGRRVAILTDATSTGYLNEALVVSNTADTLTVAAWEGGTPTAGQRLFVGVGIWRDYHPAQGYVHPSEAGSTYSKRGGSAWDNGGAGVGPDAGIIREFLDRVFRSDPWFQLAKFTSDAPTVGGWDSASADGIVALNAEMVRMGTAWTAQGGGDTLYWDLVVIDNSQQDVMDWELNPENGLEYLDSLVACIDQVRTMLSNDALKIILVNHSEVLNSGVVSYGTQYANQVHDTLAAADSNIRTINLANARTAADSASYVATGNRPGYAAAEYWGRYATEVRKAYERLIAETSGAFNGALASFLFIGDDMAVGEITESFAASNDSSVYTGGSRDATESVYNARASSREAYNLAANSNTSGTIDTTAGPEFSALPALVAVNPDGVFVVKRGSRGSALATASAAYGTNGTSGGRWVKAYASTEHYGRATDLWDVAQQAVFITDGLQLDLQGVAVMLGTEDQKSVGGGDAFVDALPAFVANLRADYATRTGGSTLPIVWVVPQLAHRLAEDDESRIIRAAIRDYASGDAKFTAVEIDDLERDVDNETLTARSHVTLGERIAAAFRRMNR